MDKIPCIRPIWQSMYSIGVGSAQRRPSQPPGSKFETVRARLGGVVFGEYSLVHRLVVFGEYSLVKFFNLSAVCTIAGSGTQSWIQRGSRG